MVGGFTILFSLLFDSNIFDYINMGSVSIAGSECTRMCIATVRVISSSIYRFKSDESTLSTFYT